MISFESVFRIFCPKNAIGEHSRVQGPHSVIRLPRFSGFSNSYPLTEECEMTKRSNFTSDFKARVALQAPQGNKN